MTTLKESPSLAPAVPPTMLPNTCGEETDLPGVPRVGCVAAVAYRPESLYGFAACFVGLADGVALLGPDLAQRRHGRHCLLTRHLWRPAVQVEEGSGRPAADAHDGLGGAAAPVRGAPAPALLSHTEGSSSASIVTLTACLAAGEGGCEGDDTAAVVVVWADAALQHHVTVLSVRLRAILTPCASFSAGCRTVPSESGLVQVVAHRALPLCCGQSVLRLFYHPAMAAPHAAPETRHVVTCSVYSPWAATAHAGGGAGGATGLERGGTATAARRRGELLFLTISATVATEDAGNSNGDAVCDGVTCGRLRVRAAPSASEHVAPWLLPFQPGRVVCAFAVQSASTSVIAAAGTTDGRVYLLGQTTQRLVRRVSGPVADAVFVRTRPAKAQSVARHAVVDDLLEDAMAEDTVKNGSFTSQTGEEMARRDGSDFAALVVLDSSGHLLVLRAVNSGAAITQSVADLPQVVALSNTHQQPQQDLPFVSTTMTSLEEGTQISSKSFLDLSTLRHFFWRRRHPPPQAHPPAPSHQQPKAHQQPPQPAPSQLPIHHAPPQQQQQQRRPGGGSPSPANPPLASSSLTTSPANHSFVGNAAAGEEPPIAGHILSRGLLCVTCIDNAKGGTELVVSTMGQVVVSVPFSPVDGCFRIAGFTVTPAPMFYVGFLDFFADGNPTLVMAGLKNVLVASRPQSTLRDRAQLLLRLLNKKERERQNADSDGAVEA